MWIVEELDKNVASQMFVFLCAILPRNLGWTPQGFKVQKRFPERLCKEVVTLEMPHYFLFEDEDGHQGKGVTCVDGS